MCVLSISTKDIVARDCLLAENDADIVSRLSLSYDDICDHIRNVDRTLDKSIE